MKNQLHNQSPKDGNSPLHDHLMNFIPVDVHDIQLLSLAHHLRGNYHQINKPPMDLIKVANPGQDSVEEDTVHDVPGLLQVLGLTRDTTALNQQVR